MWRIQIIYTRIAVHVLSQHYMIGRRLLARICKRDILKDKLKCKISSLLSSRTKIFRQMLRLLLICLFCKMNHYKELITVVGRAHKSQMFHLI